MVTPATSGDLWRGERVVRRAPGGGAEEAGLGGQLVLSTVY